VQNVQRLGVSWDVEIDQYRVGRTIYCANARYEIDVSLNNVTAEPVGREQRTLEVHAHALLPVADGSALERRRHCRCRKPIFAVLAHGKAGAVDRNALAVDEIGIRRADAQLATGIGLANADYLPDFLDQPGEHSGLMQRVRGHHVFPELNSSHNRQT